MVSDAWDAVCLHWTNFLRWKFYINDLSGSRLCNVQVKHSWESTGRRWCLSPEIEVAGTGGQRLDRNWCAEMEGGCFCQMLRGRGAQGFQVGHSALRRTAVAEAGEKERREADSRVLQGGENVCSGLTQPGFKSWFCYFLLAFCYLCGCWFSHLYRRVTVLFHRGPWMFFGFCFIFGSSLLCVGFLWLWWTGATLLIAVTSLVAEHRLLARRLQYLRHAGLVALWHVDSSQSRD